MDNSPSAEYDFLFFQFQYSQWAIKNAREPVH